MISGSAAISSCDRARQSDNAIGMLQEMRRCLLVPDVISYSEMGASERRICCLRVREGQQWEQAVGAGEGIFGYVYL